MVKPVNQVLAGSGHEPDPAQPLEETGFVFPRELMLPDPDHRPAQGAEGAGDEPIAGAIAAQLLEPEYRVGLWLCGVLRATVPETPVDEDGEPSPGKNEIGFAENRPASPPSGDSVRAKQSHQFA